ncbi:MAG: class I SAM-dependent methyltransferase [Hyphomicrobium sp.]
MMTKTAIVPNAWAHLRKFLALGHRVEQLRGKVQRLEDKTSRLLEDLDQARSGLAHITYLLSSRGFDEETEVAGAAPLPIRRDDRETVLSRLQRDYPLAYPVWKDLFDNGVIEYNEQKGLSLPTHPMAIKFGHYIRAFGKGALLDIGCGPQPIPVYLDGWPLHLIAGMDPLPAASDHPFGFASGVAENIPWADSSFDTVVLGTSLDHVIDLGKAISEIRRVTKDRGRVLVWAGLLAKGTPYDPHAANQSPADEYHLFHLDRPTFESAFSQGFRIIDISPESATDYFYSFSVTK